MLHAKDGGVKSRKLILTYVCLAIVFVGAIIAAKWPPFATQYTAFLGGVISLYGAYCGVNVANSWVVGKTTMTPPVAMDPNPAKPDASQTLSDLAASQDA